MDDKTNKYQQERQKKNKSGNRHIRKNRIQFKKSNQMFVQLCFQYAAVNQYLGHRQDSWPISIFCRRHRRCVTEANESIIWNNMIANN